MSGTTLPTSLATLVSALPVDLQNLAYALYVLIAANVVGPGVAVNNDIAVWDGTSGLLLKDSGILVTNVVLGPGAAVNNNIVVFDSTTGKLVKDGGQTIAAVIAAAVAASGNVTGPGSSTAGHIATFADGTGKLLADGGSPGTGNVTGPAGATDGHLAVYNGATGLIIKDGGPVPGAGGLSLIQTQKLGADASPVTFSAISGSFTHLELIIQARTTEAITDDYGYLQFNGDTGANYDFEQFQYVGVTLSVARQYANTKGRLGDFAGANASSANQAGIIRVMIPNYKNTDFFKNYVTNNGSIFNTSGDSIVVGSWSGSWRNTAAITQIDIISQANNWKAGSLFSLYGWA